MQDKIMILVGCGNMGRAMLEGWLGKKMLHPDNIYVVEPMSELHAKPRSFGCHIFTDAAQLPPDLAPDFILFAIKPQLFDAVVPNYAHFASSSHFISILAGIPSVKFQQALGDKAALIRVMPNTPAAIGEGMLAFCDNGRVEKSALDFVKKLLSVSGLVVQVREDQMDAVTGLSGSGPAYVFYMIECLTKAGTTVGLDGETALALARQTVKGAGILAATTDVSPATLREQVTSPNGTTAAGLRVLCQEDGLQKMMIECVKAARDRSVELGT